MALGTFVLAAGVLRIGGMNCDARPGALAHTVRRAGVVAIRDQDARDAFALQPIEDLRGRLNGVDAKVALGAENQRAIEVVSVRLGEPRPAQDPRK